MPASPAISVIIPIYNVENYIERCVASIASQTFRDFEVIFVDDCSPDASMEVLHAVLGKSSIKNFKIVKHDTNQGLAVSRVDGLKAAQGHYVIHVDSDDYVHPRYLEKLYEAAIGSDADMVMCDFYEFTLHDVVEKKRHLPEQRNELVKGLLTGEVANSVWTKLVKRSLIFDHEIFQIPGLNYLEDKSVSFRIAYFANKVVHIAEPLYYYNIANPSAITRSSKQGMINQAMMLLKLIDQFFACHDHDEIIDRGIHVCRALIAGMVIMHGTKEQIESCMPAIGEFTASEVLEAKTIPTHYKLFILCQKYHLTCISSVIRSCYRSYTAFKSITRK